MMDAGVLVAGKSGQIEAPSIVYLIEGPETILVDTSFGDPERMTQSQPGFECHRSRDQQLNHVLNAHGHALADIDTVVFTHLDWDHCHNLSYFDETTTFVVQREELEYATDPHPPHVMRYEAANQQRKRNQPWIDRDIRSIEGRTELCSGVIAFPTPGHTPGHQSLSVETEAGTTVVAADAVPTFRNIDCDSEKPRRLGGATDEIAWWESAAVVLDQADTILPGHDWEVVGSEPTGLAE